MLGQVLFGSVRKISRLDSQSKSRCFHYLPAAKLAWRTKEVLQHGGSILNSIILLRIFRQISQLWDNEHTLNLENSLLYLPSIILQFLDSIHCMVFFYFLLRDNAHTLLNWVECRLVWNHTRDFKSNERAAQVWFQTKLARPEVQLPLY